jgi:hypothetical protein
MVIGDAPEMQLQLVSSHGMLAILEVLEAKPSRDVIIRLLKTVNLVRRVFFTSQSVSDIR